MSSITLNDHTCPNCGGNLTFDTKSKTAECKSCGTVFSIEEEKDNLFELNYSESGKVQSMKVNIPSPIKIIDRISEKAAQKREEERIQAEIQEQKNKEHFRKYKYFYIVGAVLFVGFLVLMCILEEKDNKNKISMPCASADFYGDNYEDVVKVLTKAGFTNISTYPQNDLVSGFLYNDGEFDEISIDGDNSSFSKGTYFEPDADIVVRYHSYPEERKEEIVVDNSAETTRAELKRATDSPDVVIERYNSNNPPIKVVDVITDDSGFSPHTTDFGITDGSPYYELTSSMEFNEENLDKFLAETGRFLLAVYPGLSKGQIDDTLDRFRNDDRHIYDLVKGDSISFSAGKTENGDSYFEVHVFEKWW